MNTHHGHWRSLVLLLRGSSSILLFNSQCLWWKMRRGSIWWKSAISRRDKPSSIIGHADGLWSSSKIMLVKSFIFVRMPVSSAVVTTMMTSWNWQIIIDQVLLELDFLATGHQISWTAKDSVIQLSLPCVEFEFPALVFHRAQIHPIDLAVDRADFVVDRMSEKATWNHGQIITAVTHIFSAKMYPSSLDRS